MTQQHDPVDEVDVEQSGLDAEQSGVETPQYVPLAQFQAIEQQLARLAQQQAESMRLIQGVQKGADKRINELRRMTAEQQRRAQEAQNRAQLEALAANMEDPQMKAFAQRLLASTPAPSPAIEPDDEPEAPAAPPPANDPMEDVYQMVEAMGGKRDMPGIDYAVLSNTSLGLEERRKRFFASVGQAIRSSNGAAATAPKTPTASKPASPSPTVASGAAGAGRRYKSQDELIDDYLADKLTKEQAKEIAQKSGWRF